MQTETTKLRELTIRYAVRRDTAGRHVLIGRTLNSPKDAAAAFLATLQDEPSEVFAMLCLTTKHRVIAYHEVSRGTLDATLVHPREVFRPALREAAAAVVLVHNHPSGDPTPSREDQEITERLAAAGELLGIPVLDHVVVAERGYVSLRESDLLRTGTGLAGGTG